MPTAPPSHAAIKIFILSLVALFVAGAGSVVQPGTGGLSTTIAAAAPAKKVASAKKCVKVGDLKKVKKGMTVTRAKKVLAGKKVYWQTSGGITNGWPTPCTKTTAMSIYAEKGQVAFVVNSAEKPTKTCTTFAKMKTIKKGMTPQQVSSILKGRTIDKSSYGKYASWYPVPCQEWGLLIVEFRSSRVDSVVSTFYFG